MRVFNSNLEEIAKKRGPSKPLSPDQVIGIFDVYTNALLGLTLSMWEGQEFNFAPTDESKTKISVQRHGKDDTYLALSDNEATLSLSFDDNESRKVREIVIRFLAGDLEGVAKLLKK